MIDPVPAVAALAPYSLADRLPDGWAALAQNESAFAPAPAVLAAGAAALQDARCYSDPDWTDLRMTITDVHDVAPESILCGAGSMELIGALIRAFAGPGDRVLGTAFGYLFVATACRQAGAQYDRAAEPDCRVSVDTLLADMRPETRIVFVCNPGNPTGTRIPNAELVRLRATLPGNVLLIIDQAYAEFDEQGPNALFSLVDRGDSVVLRTFSKAYGLAGARVGWGLFPPDVASQVRKLLNPNNISGVSQAMAAAAMRDQAYMRDVVHRTARIREGVAHDLVAAGYAVPESHTNFLLIPFGSEKAAQSADAKLRTAQLLVRGMGGYGLGNCLRATIGSPEEMDRLTSVLVSFRENAHGH